MQMYRLVTPPPIPAPSPSDSGTISEQVADKAVTTTINVLGLGGGILMAAAIGLGVALLSSVIGRAIGRRHRVVYLFGRRGQSAWIVTWMVLGALIGSGWAAAGLETERSPWVQLLQHGLWIALIICLAWWLASSLNAVQDLTTEKYSDTSSGRARRITTQAQVLQRVLQAAVVVAAVVAIVLSFPSARAAMGSVLASAGIISLIAGLAAQSMLANIIAGMQIAFSDAIRVDDVVVVDGTQGTIEEITLTYVVVRCWDDRRLILPSKRFADGSFENWTRRASQLLGTVEIEVDWRVPMAALRVEVERLLEATDLWDQRTFSVQLTEATGGRVLARVVVSGQNAGNLWDLRCYLRESLVDWMQTEAPYAIPRRHLELDKIAEIPHDLGHDQIQAEALDLIEMAHATDFADVQKLVARERRRPWRDKAEDLKDSQEASENKNISEAAGLTRTMTATTISAQRLYSGSPEADARGQRLSGPSAEVIAEREKAASERDSGPGEAKQGSAQQDPSPGVPAPKLHGKGQDND